MDADNFFQYLSCVYWSTNMSLYIADADREQVGHWPICNADITLLYFLVFNKIQQFNNNDK